MHPTSSSDLNVRLGLGALCFVFGVLAGSLGLWTLQKYKRNSGPATEMTHGESKEHGLVRMGEACEGKPGSDGLSMHTYRRRTSQNEYELTVGCGADDRESQLHPRMRALSLVVVPDKPTTVLSLVEDLAEIRTWCTPPCSLVQEDWLPEGLVAYSTAPKAEDLGLATFLANRTPRGRAINEDVERRFATWYAQITRLLMTGASDARAIEVKYSRLKNQPPPHPTPAVIFWMFPGAQSNDWRNLNIKEIEFCGFEVFPLVSEPPSAPHGGQLLAELGQ